MRNRWCVCVVLVMLSVSCRSTPTGNDIDPSEIPSYSHLSESHNRRVEQLRHLYAHGVMEIRWRDESGGHFEQGDLDLWLTLPRNTALRVEKLGEVLLWLGSDEERYWLFDLLAEETVLHTGELNHWGLENSGWAGDLSPLVLLDVLALTPLPDASGAPPTVAHDPASDSWMVECVGAGGPMRVFFDRQDRLPRRVETLSSTGDVLLASSLSRYESVRLKGMSPAAFPKMAELIDIHEVAGTTGEGHLRVALNEATGIVDDQPLDRVFDLERLMAGLRPDRIERRGP